MTKNSITLYEFIGLNLVISLSEVLIFRPPSIPAFFYIKILRKILITNTTYVNRENTNRKLYEEANHIIETEKKTPNGKQKD